ncbi:peptidoglycan bridge formation glycyltransferase FemA/FemB family protein [Flagellimonas sp.]|uniref:peptidoglycan bridge formation glycyltransferase FemA/FemB family protein n=1 Tax=Flagellimonas sp. TaxID=2058762 RepID=UPI003BABC4E4
MIQVVEDKKSWDAHISGFKNADLYHTFDYHQAAKDDGKPILIIYKQDDICIGLPLLIRNIKETSLKDATSVYGYPGPLYKNVSDSFDGEKFKEELIGCFKDYNIISVFSRLSPFLPLQPKLLENIGVVERKGPVVIIDLTHPIDIQRQGFGKRLKGHLNKARRSSHVKTARSESEIQTFMDIYHENMDRVNAKTMYYFKDDYFKKLIDSNSFHTETLLAVHNESDEVMGGSMFFYKNSIVHYHLSGTRTKYLPLMPTKLLIDEMRIKATEKGLTHFNLGGGLSSADDSLLQFKSSFSKTMLDFYVWKLVVNPEAYHSLTEKFKLGNHDFFPLYRCNNQLVFSTK